MNLRDTRNLALGALPLDEEPGGDEATAPAASLLDNVTVRKNFTPVPYYNPAIIVGADGKAEVRIKLAELALRLQGAGEGGERRRPLRLRQGQPARCGCR